MLRAKFELPREKLGPRWMRNKQRRVGSSSSSSRLSCRWQSATAGDTGWHPGDLRVAAVKCRVPRHGFRKGTPAKRKSPGGALPEAFRIHACFAQSWPTRLLLGVALLNVAFLMVAAEQTPSLLVVTLLMVALLSAITLLAMAAFLMVSTEQA
jgi:hypothetical protein